MSGFDQQAIKIRASAKRNVVATFALAALLLLVGALWLAITPSHLYLAGYFLLCASLVAILIGTFKLVEPDHSLHITPESLTYNHRRGSWMLIWQNIQRIGQPKITVGIEQKSLEMVGFKLKQYDDFIVGISPRLATHLLSEQRPLLMQAQMSDCKTGNCQADWLEDTKYKLPSGKVLTGVQAMLANRMTKLREHLGYDVFIAVTEIDRQPQEFVDLLKSCQTSHQVLKHHAE